VGGSDVRLEDERDLILRNEEKREERKQSRGRDRKRRWLFVVVVIVDRGPITTSTDASPTSKGSQGQTEGESPSNHADMSLFESGKGKKRTRTELLVTGDCSPYTPS
jgi:hypothetical protein